MSLFSLVISIQAQNKFEGYNIILNAPEIHRSPTCALRYMPPTTNIIVSDLNSATPFQPKSCNGSGSNIVKNTSSTATVKASSNNFKWCFEGEDEMYRISFQGDQYSGQIIYNWIATPKADKLGTYNIRDFGAIGDGKADDTTAIRGALAFIASRNGGILQFPEGDYKVTDSLTLPSGITIQGINGIHTRASINNVVSNNPTRINLAKTKSALFRIGECTEKVSVKDIELYSESNDRTYGVEAVGAYLSAQDIYFENVTFQNFFRGIQVQGLPQTDKQWQFDYVKIKNSRFVFNSDAGIYCDVRNSDWKIEGSLFLPPKKTASNNAISMHFERVGMVLISDTYGGGSANALAGVFLNVLDAGLITVIGSEAENVTHSFVYNGVENPYAGDYSYPITFINVAFGHPVVFKARRTFVSVGSLYGANNFKADERVRVYSTGDRFCYDGYTWGCVESGSKTNFDKATVVFMTGQPDDGKVKGHPTYFGTDVQFGSPVQIPNFLFNKLPSGKPNGSLVYCEDCQRNQTPCRGGGTGSPAMMVSERWSCM